jgi:hypothetical protein
MFGINYDDITDDLLVEIAKDKLLNKIVSVSNGGGSFEKVKLIKCEGIHYRNFNVEQKEVKFLTDDDYVKYVYYSKKTILDNSNKEKIKYIKDKMYAMDNDEYIHIKKDELFDYVKNLIEDNWTVDSSWIPCLNVSEGCIDNIINLQFNFMGKEVSSTQIMIPNK